MAILQTFRNQRHHLWYLVSRAFFVKGLTRCLEDLKCHVR